MSILKAVRALKSAYSYIPQTRFIAKGAILLITSDEAEELEEKLPFRISPFYFRVHDGSGVPAEIYQAGFTYGIMLSDCDPDQKEQICITLLNCYIGG